MYRTQEEIDAMYEAIRQYEAEGLSVREMAMRLKVSEVTVYRYRKGFVGVRLRDYGKDQRMTLTPAQIEEMRQLREGGATYTELSDRYNVSYCCVVYWLNEKYRQLSIKRASEWSIRRRQDLEYMKNFCRRTCEQLHRRNQLLKTICKEESK